MGKEADPKEKEGKEAKAKDPIPEVPEAPPAPPAPPSAPKDKPRAKFLTCGACGKRAVGKRTRICTNCGARMIVTFQGGDGKGNPEDREPSHVEAPPEGGTEFRDWFEELLG